MSLLYMEIAIPLVALGGLFVISNKRNNTETDITQNEGLVEGMESMDANGIPRNNVEIDQKKTAQENRDFKVDGVYLNNESTLSNVNYNGSQTTDSFFDTRSRITAQHSSCSQSPLLANGGTTTSMSGQPFVESSFRHNNMQPFFGGKIRGPTTDYDKTQSMLDNRIGAASETFHKEERAPLFKPQGGLSYAHGAPNMNEYLQNRVVPGTKISNVLPFEQTQVGPGLDKGYSAGGCGGFNSGMEARDTWQPRTVDELRIPTNPKQTYSLQGHQGPANSYIKERGVEGTVEKYRPDTFYEQRKEQWLTTTGAEIAPTLREIHNVHNDRREETSNSYTGAARGKNMSNMGTSEHEESKRNVYESVNLTPAIAVGANGATTGDYGIQSEQVYLNNRASTENRHIFGAVGNALGSVVAPLLDMLRPSRKENMTGNVRLYGDASSRVPSSYVNNPRDQPRVTNRQMDTKSIEHYNVQAQTDGGYYANQHQPVGNQRDTTQAYYVGSGVSSNGIALYDAAYKQTNNQTKEIAVKSRTAIGNTQIYSGDINMSVAKCEDDRQNNRMWVPSHKHSVPPSTQVYGRVDQPTSMLEEKTNNDRIQPDLLNAFKQNPYTHSLQSSI
jgi:hypothetical protein